MRKKFIVGNWKMYKNKKDAKSFITEFKNIYSKKDNIDVGICAPFLNLELLKKASSGTDINIGAQNMHFAEEGAYTGEISPVMLKEIGINLCIIGHSERRQYFGETDETVNSKLQKAFEHRILPIMCVGENLEQRDAGQAEDFVKGQVEKGLSGISGDDVKNMVIAYEPIWAIGTGRTASPEQAQEMCKHIRKVVSELYSKAVSESLIVQYGGSVKPANAKELLSQGDIDGALVGGASLKADDFEKIVNY